MQGYLEGMAEMFKLAAMCRDNSATGKLSRLLELSTQPVKAWAYWLDVRDSFNHIGVDTITLQDITDYLYGRVKQ